MVEGTSQYNDSKAVAFREAAKKGGGSLSFSYIDASLQEDFLSTFKWSRTAESCDDGTTARKVSHCVMEGSSDHYPIIL